MKKPPILLLLIFSIMFSLSLVSFVFCIIAESKKTKKEDVKLDNKLCYVPQSDAFDYGIGALVCIVTAHIIGNLVFCGNYCCRYNRNSGLKSKQPIISIILLVFSWTSFAIAVIILSAATSMSTKQSYGKGWIDQECYIVKAGVYTSCGILSLFTFVTLGSSILTIRKAKAEKQESLKTQA